MEQNAGRIYHSHNIVNLCIDTYTAKMQCGKLWCQYREVPVTFTSLIEALRWMEDLYDTLRYPQAAARTRSFCGGGSGGMISLEADTDEAGAASAEEYDHGRAGILAGDGRGDLSVRRRHGREITVGGTEALERVISHRGEAATFLIRVQYRQNSSWQGEVVWADQGRRQYFNSVLDLIRLIDSALEGTEGISLAS